MRPPRHLKTKWKEARKLRRVKAKLFGLFYQTSDYGERERYSVNYHHLDEFRETLQSEIDRLEGR